MLLKNKYLNCIESIVKQLCNNTNIDYTKTAINARKTILL